MTQISSLGEFGLIRKLTNQLPQQQPSTRKGVGDDAAVMNFGDNQVLMTTDMLLEGIHFNLEYVPLKHLGYKAAVVNFSDIYAMNGTPTQITVSLGLSRRFTVEQVEELYSGIRLACERYGVDLVGGDTCASLTGLTISITCLGTAKADEIVYRNGAKENDLICVTGNLGTAYMGLLLLERERQAWTQSDSKAKEVRSPGRTTGDTCAPGLQSDTAAVFEGKEYLLERQLKPEARRDIIAKLRKAGIQPTAMMDVSDGLSSELLHICKQSNVGCRIFEKNIPIDYQTAVMAEELNMNVTTCALNGGEDYELLFTVPIGDHERVKDIDGVHLIGHITKESLGKVLVTRDDNEFELKAQGWNPLA